jgi:hypothetical protein
MLVEGPSNPDVGLFKKIFHPKDLKLLLNSFHASKHFLGSTTIKQGTKNLKNTSKMLVQGL